MNVDVESEMKDEQYFVVRNNEEQYSIWRVGMKIPDGWEVVGQPGSKEQCLDRVGVLWVDMRPASLRRFMNGQA